LPGIDVLALDRSNAGPVKSVQLRCGSRPRGQTHGWTPYPQVVKLQRKGNPVTEPVAPTEAPRPGAKGRPTPKRREAAPKRQPLAAPRTTKEASRWRKQQNTQTRKGPAAGKPMSTQEYRAAMRRGDEAVLTRRDKGPVRKLARDWVDSHIMLSNYLLLAFPLLIFAGALPDRIGTFALLFVFGLFGVEWLWTGRRIHALATSRMDRVADKPWVLGLYAGQRAFLPRRFRTPEAKVKRGDTI